MEKRGKNRALLMDVLQLLQEEQPLPPQYKDHALSGKLKGYRDCHIENDWVLVYAVNQGELLLTAIRTGTHADLGW
jgi:mRNA interferase YafQ